MKTNWISNNKIKSRKNNKINSNNIFKSGLLELDQILYIYILNDEQSRLDLSNAGKVTELISCKVWQMNDAEAGTLKASRVIN
jgi:hypothetical protein